MYCPSQLFFVDQGTSKDIHSTFNLDELYWPPLTFKINLKSYYYSSTGRELFLVGLNNVLTLESIYNQLFFLKEQKLDQYKNEFNTNIQFSCSMLQNEILPALRDRLTEEEFSKVIYMHDGSTIQLTA